MSTIDKIINTFTAIENYQSTSSITQKSKKDLVKESLASATAFINALERDTPLDVEKLKILAGKMKDVAGQDHEGVKRIQTIVNEQLLHSIHDPLQYHMADYTSLEELIPLSNSEGLLNGIIDAGVVERRLRKLNPDPTVTTERMKAAIQNITKSGPSDAATLLGRPVDDSQSIPSDLIDELVKQDPYEPTKLKGETSLLLFMPEEVTGEELQKMVKRLHPDNPNGYSRYSNGLVLPDLAKLSTGKGRWRLVRIDPPQASFSQTYDQQKTLIEAAGDQLMTAPEAIFFLYAAQAKLGRRLYEQTCMRTQTPFGDRHVVVGRFDSDGLDVNHYFGFGFSFMGAGVLRGSKDIGP